MKSILILLAVVIFFSITIYNGCSGEKSDGESRVVVGISSDAETLNPLYAFSPTEGNINGLLFLSLVQHKWNEEKGDLDTEPMLAESWEWNEDSTSIIINLRDDVFWSDSIQVTAEDVVFSYDAYSHPEVQSRMYGLFTKILTDNDNHIIIDSVFKIEGSHKLKINFLPGFAPSLFDIDIPLIPKHVFSKIEKKDFLTTPYNISPVTNGPFKLGKWEKNEFISLHVNDESFLYNPDAIKEIVFKILPYYNSRLTQLKNGEIDILEEINPKDAAGLNSNKDLKIVPVKGREIEYVGWNNIDPRSKGKVTPHPLFGNASVRSALTYSINSEEILNEFLLNYGELAAGPVSPIFKNYINTSNEISFQYDTEKAKEILQSNLWIDSNNDGIREKNGRNFSFKLSIPSGKPRRDFAATLIKNNLKEVGIDVEIETLEFGVFIEKLFSNELDAWIASNYISLPLDLKPIWYSGVPFNLFNYSSKKIDTLLDKLQTNLTDAEKKNVYLEMQKIIQTDQPVTFLYWISNIVAYNSKIKNTDINPLGVVHNCWHWTLEE